MKSSNLLREVRRLNGSFIIIGLILFFLTVFGCGGGGSSGGNTSNNNGGGLPPPPASESVAISGTVDDGTSNSPIANAVCTFKDSNGNPISSITADANGAYTLTVLPDETGRLYCRPADIQKLFLLTYLDTTGMKARDALPNEDVTPATTVVANIIAVTSPADPQARKKELLADIASGQDADLERLVLASTELFTSMLKQRIDVNFGGGGGGSGGSGSGGGTGGSAGDGGDGTPIGGAHCEFIVGSDLQGGKVLFDAALNDLLDDGNIERPDLKAVKAQLDAMVNANGGKQAFVDAYNKFFKDTGIGNPLAADANSNGEYFINTPTDVPGFIRCRPPDQPQLVLATYVRGRNAGEDLMGEDLNPSTTLFSNNIAAKLSATVDASGLEALKENYLADTEGLGLVHEEITDNKITGFVLQDPSSQKDKDVTMAAYTATSLYLSYFKNDINNNFIAALNQVTSDGSINVNNTGLPQPQVETLNSGVDATTQALNSNGNPGITGLGPALQRARVEVTVKDANGGAVAGANVTILDPSSSTTGNVFAFADCEVDGETQSNCTAVTDSSGQVHFLLNPAPVTPTEVTVQALLSDPDLTQRGTATTQVVALATQTISIALAP